MFSSESSDEGSADRCCQCIATTRVNDERVIAKRKQKRVVNWRRGIAPMPGSGRFSGQYEARDAEESSVTYCVTHIYYLIDNISAQLY